MIDRARERSAEFRNLVYAERDGRQLLMDIYRPDADGPVPVALYLHPGGWRSGTKDHCLVRWLVRYGIAVASIDYRLLPRHRFPDALHDAKAAVRYLREHADSYGLNHGAIAAVGVSAGAYLANMLGLTAHVSALNDPEHPDEPPATVDAVVNYFGFTDFIAMQDDRTRRGDRAARAAPEARLLGHAVGDDPARGRLASPLYHVTPETPDTPHTPDAPPFLHVHGELNEHVPLDQARRLHQALQAAGVSSKLVLVRGVDHRAPPILDNPSIRDRVAHFIHTRAAADAPTPDAAAPRSR